MRIVFYPAQSGKRWSGPTLEEQALGGSETAVIEMARSLAKQGHEVFVFTRGPSQEHQGVVYVNFDRAQNYFLTLPMDVLVCVRDVLPLVRPHRAPLTVAWLHDVPMGVFPDAHYYFCVSRWQAAVGVQQGYFPMGKAKLTPNGIRLNQFPQQPPAVRPLTPDEVVKFVWTSNPERGLWQAGEVLQRVRKEYPRAELHVYGRNTVYGWAGEYEHNFYPDVMDGVVLHDPLPKAALAAELGEYDLWLYPTWWPETYCIAALEAQAAGVPVLSSNFAALNDTIASPLAKVEGRADGADFLDRFTARTLELLADTQERSLIQQAGVLFARTQDWDHHARAWNDTLSSTLGLS